MPGRFCLEILMLGVFALAANAAVAAEQYLAYLGVAASQRSGQKLYEERHVLSYRDGRLAERVVLYTCVDGTPFARKTATYENALAPSFLFEDISSGVREGVRSGSPRQVFFRA